MRRAGTLGLTWALAGAALGQPPDPPPVPTIPAAPSPVETVVGPLVEALADADAEVRLQAAAALAECGPPALEPLTKALADGSAPRRAAAAYALGLMGRAASPALPELTRLLKDGDRAARRQAATALSRVMADLRRPATRPAPPGGP